MRRLSFVSVGLLVTSVFWASATFAVDVGDRVYGVFGPHDSDLSVYGGYVRVAGSSSSKVEWDYCYNCNEWISNGSLWYSRSSAQEYANKKDSEHTSFGEGAAIGIGAMILYCISDSSNCKF